MAYPDWTYEQYLEQYEQLESTIEAGEYGYYSRGKHVKCDIPKLTQVEFEQHKASLEAANRNFDEAHKVQNLEAMDKALSESFPHELILLV